MVKADPQRVAERTLSGFWRQTVAAAVLSVCAACTFEPSARLGGKIIEIGRRGTGPGRFNSPRALAVSPTDDLYVIDKTGRIQRLTLDGESVAVWRVPDAANGTPTGMTLAPNGDLIVADNHYSRILRYSADATTLTQFGRYGKKPGELVYPTDVAVDRAGNIYVMNYGGRNRVVKFRGDGTFVKEWGSTGDGPGQFHRPMAIAILDDAEIVVADSCNHRIQRFDLEGRLLGMWGEVGQGRGQLSYPYDVAVGPKGKIYVCEYGNNRVSKFTREGKFRGAVGDLGNGRGRFRGPWGLAFDKEGRLYVADTSNHRIQRFKAGTI